MTERRDSIRALVMSTLAFAVCFACWVLNGVLITHLVEAQLFVFSKAQVGWLLGVPILTGSILRLPAGLLTDKYGGRAVFTGLMLVSALPMYLTSLASTFGEFLAASLCFGLTGASFAVGVAYVAVWTPPQRMGTALGIFGAGNAGAALTSIVGPILLSKLTFGGQYLDGWRTLPRIYAALLVITGFTFYLLTRTRLPGQGSGQSLAQRLIPLRSLQVWRFGLYYVAVFGGFVALSQWMIPYYVNSYGVSVSTAGLLTACFSLPSAATRSLGGWLADRIGARSVMYWVFGVMIIGCGMLMIPKMDIESPGEGIMASASGTVRAVSASHVLIDNKSYGLQVPPPAGDASTALEMLVFPVITQWQEPVVKEGDRVSRQQLLARGITHLHFQANIVVFTAILFVVGCAMGIGMAGVFKHIPYYFPNSVGVTGGMVGVIGGLGGFACPILFGYLLRLSGFWISCWGFLLILALICLIWMHAVIRRMLRERAPDLEQLIERH